MIYWKLGFNLDWILDFGLCASKDFALLQGLCASRTLRLRWISFTARRLVHNGHRLRIEPSLDTLISTQTPNCSRYLQQTTAEENTYIKALHVVYCPPALAHSLVKESSLETLIASHTPNCSKILTADHCRRTHLYQTLSTHPPKPLKLHHLDHSNEQTSLESYTSPPYNTHPNNNTSLIIFFFLVSTA